MTARSIHPFPARMAPELALGSLGALASGSVVLDPMTGSGTVAHQAKSLGHCALGFDLDPLAVLISKVATTPVRDDDLSSAGSFLLNEARSLETKYELSWIDGDERSESFINFWFDKPQREDLRKIAYVLHRAETYGLSEPVANALRVALSRIIVTKKPRASLAGDTSHSRPHKVLTKNEYAVFDGFEKSLRSLRKRLAQISLEGSASIGHGDARKLDAVADSSVDLVLTSPPYLNAIDYMRGHKMSLIWLGFQLDQLTQTRSKSIGAERKASGEVDRASMNAIKGAMGDLSSLPSRYQGMIERYALDLKEMLAEVARVLKPKAGATFVMGNSCLKDVYIQNSDGLIEAGRAAGLRLVETFERELPSGSRYLPTPKTGHLSKRMRKEVIVRLARA